MDSPRGWECTVLMEIARRGDLRWEGLAEYV